MTKKEKLKINRRIHMSPPFYWKKQNENISEKQKSYVNKGFTDECV